MKKGNLIFIIGGLGLLYYYFMRKSSNTIPVIRTGVPKTNDVPQSIDVPTPTPVFVPTLVSKPKYPVGLQENDLVKGTPEDVYVLLEGLAHPVTEHWFVYNVNDYSKVKRLDDYIIATLNKGDVLY